MTKSEQETTIRWDQDELVAYLNTTYPPEARRWRKKGLAVEVSDCDSQGRPRAWTARVPKDAVRLRQVCDGEIVRKPGHRKGKLFGAERHDQLVVSEDQPEAR